MGLCENWLSAVFFSMFYNLEMVSLEVIYPSSSCIYLWNNALVLKLQDWTCLDNIVHYEKLAICFFIISNHIFMPVL